MPKYVDCEVVKDKLSRTLCLYEDLPALIDSIPAADVRPRWIPVTERLPDVGKEVLCFCRANICFVLGWDDNHWHEGADRYYMSGFVTHWMPLPPAPKEG